MYQSKNSTEPRRLPLFGYAELRIPADPGPEREQVIAAIIAAVASDFYRTYSGESHAAAERFAGLMFARLTKAFAEVRQVAA